MIAPFAVDQTGFFLAQRIELSKNVYLKYSRNNIQAKPPRLLDYTEDCFLQTLKSEITDRKVNSR